MIIMQKNNLSTLQSFNHGQTWLTLLLVITLIQISTGRPLAPEVDPTESNKSIASIMGIVAIIFLFSGFLSLYSAKCTDRQQGVVFDLSLPAGTSGRRSQNNEPSNGLNQEVINTFPTFRYSDVKGLKIGKSTLACAVCLNEFQDDETLRLIPKCSHVYHHGCIDIWLYSHNTCPVCRANLVPRPDDTSVPSNISIEIEEGEDHQELNIRPSNEEEIQVIKEEKKKDNLDSEYSPKVDLLRRSRTCSEPTRSRSAGFLSGILFQRSSSTSVLVQPGEDCERFTLRLPDKVRNEMIVKNMKHKRAKSCVSFTRMSSGMCGYRTRSLRCGTGRSHVLYERFGRELEEEEQLRFIRNGWNNKSVKKAPMQCLVVDMDNNVGERSTDLLCPV